MQIITGSKYLNVYRATLTGLRISAVDGGVTESGGAFIDNAGATIPTLADGAHLIEIYDSSNRMIKGVMKAAGTGETLGDEIISSQTDRDFSGANNWVQETMNAFNSSGDLSITASAGGQYCRLPVLSAPMVKGEFYRFTCGIANPVVSIGLYDFAAVQQLGSLSIAGAYSKDFTNSNVANTGGFLLYADAATSSIDLDNLSLKQVLAPSATGVTIVSAKAGTLFNFSYKNPSFAYNEASYYVVCKLLR